MTDTLETKATILVAEDDEFLMRVLSDKLTKEHFAVVQAHDGEEALALMTQHKIDLAILDMIMPKLTGFDVIDAIKKQETLKSIPVIVLSNLGQESDITRAKEKGVEDYFVKANISLVAVIQKIHERLNI